MKRFFLLVIVFVSYTTSVFSQQDSTSSDINLNDQFKLGIGIGDRYGETTNGLSVYLSYESNPEWLFEPLGNLSWLTAGATIGYTKYTFQDDSDISSLAFGIRITSFLDEALKSVLSMPKQIQPYAGFGFGYEYFTTPEFAVVGVYSSASFFRFIGGLNVNFSDKIGAYFEVGAIQADFQTGVNFRIH